MRIRFGKWRKDNPFCYYCTPPEATRALLAREQFRPPIWECACGDGGIAKLLPADETLCTDLRDYGNPGERDGIDSTWFQRHATGGIDFLGVRLSVATILTNPPYYCLERFIGRALDCATDRVALLLDNRFVGGRRLSKFYTNGFLRVVYFLQWRLRFGRELYSVCAGHHWAVWDRSFHGAASLEFLPRPRVVSPFTEARK